MLIESAIGDSYGGGFEYVSPEIVKQFGDSLEYRHHPKHTQITPGRYTDDTQMALAISELMLDDFPFTIDILAQKFVQVFKRDERTGYSKNFYDILKKVADGQELIQTLKPDSDRSGAAMRAYPLGLYKDTKEVIEKAKIQAAITHNTPLGISAAVASALTTHFFARKLGNKSDLGFFLEFYTEDQIAWGDPYNAKVGEKGWMSVMAAVTAIMQSSSMSELLKKCISYTGDVDTVAAIALAAGSFSTELEQDLPDKLYDGLENGEFGRDYILSLDNKLLEKFGLKAQSRSSRAEQLLKRFDVLRK